MVRAKRRWPSRPFPGSAHRLRRREKGRSRTKGLTALDAARARQPCPRSQRSDPPRAGDARPCVGFHYRPISSRPAYRKLQFLFAGLITVETPANRDAFRQLSTEASGAHAFGNGVIGYYCPRSPHPLTGPTGPRVSSSSSSETLASRDSGFFEVAG